MEGTGYFGYLVKKRLIMKFDEDLSAIHGYLCADGYVVKNPREQKHKYYRICLRNTNTVLLKDFQERFFRKFGVKPIIYRDERCCVHSKQLYFKLTKNWSFYSHEWKLPKLSKNNLQYWLRAFFDCDGYVELQPAKSRTVSLDLVNLPGLKQIYQALKRFGMSSSIKPKKGGMLWGLTIAGKDDLEKFSKNIGFLHPEKNKKLEEALNSCRNFNWEIPTGKEELINFIKKYGRKQKRNGEIRFHTIRKTNLVRLKGKFKKFDIESKISGPFINQHGSINYYLVLKESQFGKLWK